MALDADTVLWALRGMHDPQDDGVRAHDVARFMSKDATLSEEYSGEDVTEVLESLVAEGTLMHASSYDATLYRFPSGVESLVPDDGTVAGVAEHNGWDHWLGLGESQPRDFLLEALAEESTVGVEVPTPTAADDAETNASLRVRIDEMEWERDALLAERDTWRQRAESADENVSVLHGEGDELRTRIRELENQLGRERILASDRLETARRAAAGLARALEDLERLEPSVPDARAQTHAGRHRRMPRGNWLQ